MNQSGRNLDKYESEIIKHLKDNKSFTNIFWLTENQKRAKASMRLEEEGIIVRKKKSKWDKYPVMVFKVME